ncbi:MAG TPA: sulfotransferase [Tepidiformaceae bacterium]|nr:sulfotransferase [Tepidiformaceae bacterium]
MRTDEIGHRMIITGGLGQSGVSTLNAALTAHPEIATCPLETCFVVTGGGLLNVTDAISDDFSPMRVDDALARFDRLMRHDLCSPRSYPFNRIDLTSIFGKGTYRNAIDQYFSEIGAERYRGDGLTIEPRIRVGDWALPGKAKRFHLPWWVGRERDYLYTMPRRSRQQAVLAGRHLIESLHGARAERLGRAVWTDQTTNNLLDADFWAELFPEALFVQVVRDPLDVAITQQRQVWGPDDFQQVCSSIRDSFERWRQVQGCIPGDAYVEVRFEDLIRSPAAVVQTVARSAGIGDGPANLDLKLDWSRLDSSSEARSRVNLDIYRTILGPVAHCLGYAVP